MKYHFTEEDVSQEFARDMATLQDVPIEIARALTQAALKILVGEVEISSIDELHTSLEPLAQKCGIANKILADVVRTLTMFFQGAVKRNLRPDYVNEDLESLGLDSDKREYICAIWKQHYVTISRNVIAQTLSVYPLKDMDWRFGVTASSSELDEVGSTFLQLKLVLDKGAGKTENVFTELSVSQFYEFLHQMEKAKAAIDYFSS